MKKLINLILFIGIIISFNGCILTHSGCIKHGKLGAMECGRYANRYDSIEKHQTQLEKLNTNMDITKLGEKSNEIDENKYINRFCKKYEGKKLPYSKDLASDFTIPLGSYYTHSFCNTYYKNKHLGLYQKTTKTSTNHGYITSYVADEKKIYDYEIQHISYFANGVIKYGIANFGN